MTEFEELALKKITKDYLIDCIYSKINSIAGRYDISNAEISRWIGWDPAGFNQKYNRSNDLRITTFIKIFVAISELIAAKEMEIGLSRQEMTTIRLDEFITEKELDVGALFNHISAVVDGKAVFLSEKKYIEAFREMRVFVLVGRKNNRYSSREFDVYNSYYNSSSH